MHFLFFFFNDTATTEIYTVYNTLSLHDALPICTQRHRRPVGRRGARRALRPDPVRGRVRALLRSEEHTSELQSLYTISYAVFCLKKKKKKKKKKTLKNKKKKKKKTKKKNKS